MFDKVKPQDIHKGDQLWESSQYGSIEFIVKEDPTHVNGKWEWVGVAHDREIEFLITDGMEHYGPRITKSPWYFPTEPLSNNGNTNV